ncbi:MAG TPA: FAD:protein FMN transferase [Bryobacterales bacterium]|nr:FAD:protein FMN transferase [Bryobacterales bacterium]
MTRRSLLLACLAATGVSPLGAQPAKSTEIERYEASASIMGSTYTIAAFGEHRAQLASAVRAAFDEARRIDAFLSNYKDESELSLINRKAADGPVPVSKELADLLGRCIEYSQASDGAFDITVGALMKVWGFYKGSGELPYAWQIAGARRKVGYQHIDVDREHSTVRFGREGLELDPGGIGKGYAVDRMAAVLRQAGIRSAFISAAGSSMYGIGAPPDEPQGWSVQIRDPNNASQTAARLHLKDQSLSTSGSYEKFFEAGGEIYSHIMDPRTGMPAQGVVSVSVLAPLTLDSEAWTKAFFVNGWDWSLKNKPDEFRVFLCRADGGCAWVGE